MDTIGPDLLDQWMAYYRLEPFGSQWRQSAQIAHEVALLRAAETARGGVTPPEVEFSHYMPMDCDHGLKDVSDRVLTPQQAEKSLAALAGF
jgi:hypothetical protein